MYVWYYSPKDGGEDICCRIYIYILYRKEHDFSRYLFCSNYFPQSLTAEFVVIFWKMLLEEPLWLLALRIWEGTHLTMFQSLDHHGQNRVYFSFGTELHQQLKLRSWPWSWGSWSVLGLLFPVPVCQLLTAGCCPPRNFKLVKQMLNLIPQDSEQAFSCWGHQGVNLMWLWTEQLLYVLTNAVRNKFLHSWTSPQKGQLKNEMLEFSKRSLFLDFVHV